MKRTRAWPVGDVGIGVAATWPAGPFTIADARHRFADAFPPRTWIYWSDLFATTAVCWTALAVSASVPLGGPLHLASTLVAMVALFRAAIFVHEIAHQRRGALPGFEFAWNVLVGVPFLAPSLTYVGSHLDHHRQATFGTWNDPEYLPLARSTPLRHLGFLLVPTVEVPMFPVRWGVLGPASWVIPPLRRWLVARASTLVLNPRYRRPAPKGRDTARWMAQEAAAAALVWLVAGGVVAGLVPVQWLLQWYVVVVGALVLNQARNLAAHRYENDGQPTDSLGQLLDSVTLEGRFLSALAAPVGLRYHALHHYLATVPYHSLGALHRRLLAELPADDPYRRTSCSGVAAAAFALARRAAARRACLSSTGTRGIKGDEMQVFDALKERKP
jgi:fatty acid desaturase